MVVEGMGMRLGLISRSFKPKRIIAPKRINEYYESYDVITYSFISFSLSV